MIATDARPVVAARERAREREALHAFISLTEEEGGERVLAVKDLVDVAGTVTTGGALREEAAVPAERDAETVARLRAAGFGVVGKTNLHEWALGPTSGNPHYGAVRNPHDESRIAGGSSGGSAAALAAGLCDLAIGTDTGGSIRIPASLCGVAGLRPTLGTVSLDGVIALSQTCDTIGPMALGVDGVIEAMELLRDDLGEVPDLGTDATALRLAAPHDWIAGRLDETTAATWERVGAALPAADGLPPLDAFIAPGLTILYTEAASNHERQVRERPETLGEDVRTLMQGGLEIPAVAYHQALQARLALQAALDRVLEGVDALLLPATACVAPEVGVDAIAIRDALTCFTRPFGVTGHPVLAVPGPSPGLPSGIQVVGRRGDDARLLAIGRTLEAAWKEAAR